MTWQPQLQRQIGKTLSCVLSFKVNNRVDAAKLRHYCLDFQEKNFTKIDINYKEKSLKKDSRISKEFVYQNNPVTNAIKGIGNAFISIHNFFNEEEQIRKNFNDYLDEIKIYFYKEL